MFDRGAIGKAFQKDVDEKSVNFWVKKGECEALRTFRKAAIRVPAYKDFLKQNRIDPKKVRTIVDFQKVPLTTKENYVEKYSLDALCWDGRLDNGATIAESSGTTTGKHFMWPRFSQQEKDAAAVHDLIFRKIYSVSKKKTLFVVCFYLGSHIAGMITVDAIKRLLDGGMPGSLITPGLQKKDTVDMVEKLHILYDQVILIGYPPFLKDIIDDLLERGFNESKCQLKLMCSGESFPERWREYIMVKTKQDPTGIINVYGSADFGLMANESPLSIYLRRAAYQDPKLSFLLGGNADYVPPLYQSYPGYRHFEEVSGELICTAENGLPLIRYAIRDAGKVIPFDSIKQYVPSELKGWKMPLITVYGRNNHTATIYALNVYPEHIQEILSQPEMARLVSGKFFMKTMYDENQDQFLELSLELAPNESLDPSKEERFGNVITQCLQKINLEYGKLYSAIGEKARVRIVCYPNESEKFKAIKMKHRYLVKQ